VSRTAFATVFVVLGCVIAGPAVAAFAMDRELTEQDRYLEAVEPLVDDPAVHRAITDQVDAALQQQVGDVPAEVRQTIDTNVVRAVESDTFRAAWVELNRQAHPQVLAMLRDESGTVGVEGDGLVVDLGAVVEQVRAQLPQDVPLPEVDASVEIVSRSALQQAAPAFTMLEQLSVILPIAAIVLLAGGLALSARRAGTLVVAGIGVALSMLLVALVVWIARDEAASRSNSPELAGALYDALTASLTTMVWVVLAISLVAAVIGAVLSVVTKRRARPQEAAWR
jgi:hypothetical protein